jgi:hypothetical protein
VILPGATSVAVSAQSTCAVADGRLHCWGEDGGNRLGDPTLRDACFGNRLTPALASGLTGWTHVTASQSMACALRDDEVWCWGTAQNNGGLGKGTWGGSGWGRVALGASDVSLGWNANIDEEGDAQDLDLACIVVDGKVQCWGDNRFGQLAQGDVTMHERPTEIAGGHRWASLVASDIHTCGVTMERELYCWGSMLSGQTIGTISGTDQMPCGAVPGVPCTLDEPTLVPFHPMADGRARRYAYVRASGNAADVLGQQRQPPARAAGLAVAVHGARRVDPRVLRRQRRIMRRDERPDVVLGFGVRPGAGSRVRRAARRHEPHLRQLDDRRRHAHE